MPRDTADAIVEWVAAGKPLRAFCRQPGQPRRTTVHDWLQKDPAFAERVARAKSIGFLELAEEALEIADDGTADVFVDDEGVERTNHEAIARSRLRVDTRLKLLACWDPRRYGAKVAVGGDPDAPPIQISNSERAARLRAILDAAKSRIAGGD